MIYDRQIAMLLYEKYSKDKGDYTDANSYYDGDSVAQSKYPVNEERCNRKFGTNHVKFMIDEEVSYMTGNKLSYISKSGNSQVVKDIEYTLDNINSCLDTELTTQFLINSVVYELYYMYEGEFKIKVCSPLESIGYIDLENNVQLFLYMYKKMLDDKTYIDVFDDKYIYHMDESFNEIAPRQEHYFGRCPVGIAIMNNGTKDTIYNAIHGLQDAYEYTLMDWSNEIGDTRLSYLTMTGCQMSEEQAKIMKEMGIISTTDANSKIGFLIKDIKPEFLKSYRDIIEEEMYKVTHHLKNQIAVQSNTSGSMLATRLNCLRIKLTTQYQCLKNCIRTRLQCLFTYLNLVENKNYDYRDIDVKFTLNLPNNDLEMAQILSQLTGKLSIKTGLSQLSFVTNADEEYKQMLAEQKEIQENSAPPKLNYDNDKNSNTDNLDNVSEDNNGNEG
ncbi:hypothetical protein CBE01nite_29670 [Clostridium beijerinckii]|uniref:Phage portal protein n=1 Tax=Clostridium beijerinckii TaxID=1520 RepID=A0AB74VDG8_CLOBE|nr:phage portal protein [Clostridium beijerinckii]NRZ28747.1 SPP1 family phage portal protein [Clostridium beijerinckii]NYB95477.1 SPP1 family phage portal protein [Clostridium beijerinckii]OOM24592.1 phage portal protein, SPP1 Gp6-like [Clostridium beijerinckii]QUN34425.1 phage portal protein [Clostridium beijerinckii]SQB00621.1 phage portal protein [Clostridium beijerinckii]